MVQNLNVYTSIMYIYINIYIHIYDIKLGGWQRSSVIECLLSINQYLDSKPDKENK